MLRIYCAMMIVTAITLSTVGDFNPLTPNSNVADIAIMSAIWPVTLFTMIEELE